MLLRGVASARCAELSPWLRLLMLAWVALGAAGASASAHWATVQHLPSLVPLRDDLLKLLGRGSQMDMHLMHGVCIGGTVAVWLASLATAPSIERALMQWMLAYGACLLVRTVCVRVTLLPDPSGPERHVSKNALMAAMTHPSATQHDMLPSGHMLVVGVTAMLAPLARAHWALTAAWVAASAWLTLVSRSHYTCDVVIGIVVGALMGNAARSAAFADLPCVD